MMSVMQTNVSVYCTASKTTLLQWRVTSADPPGVSSFVKNIPARLHCVLVKHLMRKSTNWGLSSVLYRSFYTQTFKVDDIWGSQTKLKILTQITANLECVDEGT